MVAWMCTVGLRLLLLHVFLVQCIPFCFPPVPALVPPFSFIFTSAFSTSQETQVTLHLTKGSILTLVVQDVVSCEIFVLHGQSVIYLSLLAIEFIGIRTNFHALSQHQKQGGSEKQSICQLGQILTIIQERNHWMKTQGKVNFLRHDCNQKNQSPSSYSIVINVTRYWHKTCTTYNDIETILTQ